MHVTLLRGALDDYNPVQLWTLVNRQFLANSTPEIPIDAFGVMLSHYKQYRLDGMSTGWIVNEIKAKRAQIANGAFLPTDSQIATFVAGLTRIENGDIPGDPSESPSWAEAYSMSGLTAIPWGTLALAAGGLLLLYGFAGGIGKGLVSHGR